MLKRLIYSLVLSIVPLAAGAATIDFAPTSQAIVLGGTASVQLVISGLGDHIAPSLGDFDLVVHFDPAIVASLSVSLGDPLQGDQLDLFGLGSLNGVDLSLAGLARVFEISLDDAADLESMQPASFTLATLNFVVVGLGTTTLSIDINSLGDSLGSPIDATTSTATITSVPEPGSLWVVGALFCGTLARLATARRSRSQSRPRRREPATDRRPIGLR